jgi:hypothetical protein
MSLAELARFIAAEPDFDTRWRLVVEFLKEYHREPAGAPLLDRAGIEEAFRRLGDRLARRGRGSRVHGSREIADLLGCARRIADLYGMSCRFC